TPALRDGITVFLHQHMLPYKFKDSKGKFRAKMNATGEIVQKRPLRKHKHALGTSLACLQDQVLGVHDPEIQEIRRTGLGDFTHEFLLCDVDGDWVVLESEDIVQARGFLQIKVLLRLNITFPRGDELFVASTPGMYDYSLATALDMATPNSVRDVTCHPSWAFFMFCMADPGTMTHSSALGVVRLDSAPPQLQLDPERFVQTTCLAGTHDRVYYCASVEAMDTIVYTFLHVERGGRREVDDVEPTRGTPLLVFTQPIGACLDTTSDLSTVEKHGRLDGPVNIQVILRSRPLLRHEIDRGVQSVVTCSGCNALHVAPIRSYQSSKHFTFDRVYGPASTQDDLYHTSILPLVHRVLQGYKCTVLAYGQTGSGKTHSMEGSAGDRGMIFKSIATIFDQLKGKADCRVRMSHVEIYNEELTDLLSTSQRDERKASHVDKFFVHRVKKAHPGIRGLSKMKRCDELEDFEDKVDDLPKLSIIRHPYHGVIVQGLEEVSIQSAANAQTLLERSFYSMDGSGDQSISYGQLRLVDLSGSENYDRAGAQRDRQLEAANIGQGLLALGRVIRALVEKWPHVPYRESKLTRLLEDSLGGTSMTTLLLAVSPGDEAHEETLNTLNYATLAKRVTTRPRK
ncbi:hypothetical protein DYB26_012706, partial [Aphanomyces astaci]